jgi:hypothetical protein
VIISSTTHPHQILSSPDINLWRRIQREKRDDRNAKEAQEKEILTFEVIPLPSLSDTITVTLEHHNITF